jgi:two-component system, OmpR family, sensor histidine kinase KdpD
VRKISRDQGLGFVAGTGVVAGITLVCFRLIHVSPTTVALGLLLGILYVSATWGLAVSIYMSALAALAFNYFFLPPFGTLTIADPQNWVALGAFLVTAITASRLAEQAREEARDAHRRRREVERLYAFTQQLLVAGNMGELLNSIPPRMVESFELLDAALYLASTNDVYRYGTDVRNLDKDRLKGVMARGEPFVEAEKNLSFMPVRMGVRPVGSLGIAGGPLSRQTLEAVGTLIAIAVERFNAVEALGKAEAAREEDKLRTALLDSVTHELRTPLTGIKGAITSLLSQPELTAEHRRELMAVIDEESNRLNRLIEEALEMARLDAGDIELRREPASIGSVIQVAREAMKGPLAQHPVEVRLAAQLPDVPLDFDRIKEVLAHLLENAAKYSPAGAPIIISSEVANGFLSVSVADRGPGIETIEQTLIFDKFYRGKDQRYRVQGTGMGLAICKAIVEAHGGKMGLTSQTGSGSVFHFSLPLAPRGPEAERI